MEKIAQRSASSNASSAIMDLTKNFARVDNNANFKDYIKSGNSAQKTDYRKKDEHKSVEPKADDRRKTIHDEDKNMGKMSTKKDIQNTKQEDDKEEIKSTNEVEKNEAKKTSEVKEAKTTDSKTTEQEETDKVDLEVVNNVINMIVNLDKNPVKLVEEINNLPQETLQEIQSVIENMPQLSNEVKNNLIKILDAAKKDGKIDVQLLSNLTSENSAVQLKGLNEILNKMKSIENEIVTDNSAEQKASNIDLFKELTNLKQDFSSLNNRNNTNLLNNNINNIADIVEEDINNLSITDMMNNNIKILGNNTRILSEIRGNSVNAEQIQNFSKIVDEMRIAFRDDKTTLNIKLEPETLGKLSIKIHSENGVLNASFFVESDKAKQAIEQQLQVLKQALTDQNINIQDINVQVGQNNEDLNYHKNIMEAINFSKREGIRNLEDDDFESAINPYLKEDLFNDLI